MKYFGILIILLLSYFAIQPIFINGFFPMHDDTQVARVFEMAKSLGDGMFPVRWVADLGYGYGYPIFNFYAPLAYYVGGTLAFIGFDALFATKLMIGIGILISGVSMYLLAREFWGSWGGLLSAVFYMYAPYNALNVYVRGDIAEVYAYGFIPLVFFGMYKLYQVSVEKSDKQKEKSKQNKPWKWVAVGAISYAAVILSHNLTAMMVTPIVGLAGAGLGIVSYRKEKKLHTAYYLVLTMLIGLALSAFYWLPVPFQMQYTNVLSQIGGKADYALHYVCLPQLWDSPWGYGGSAPGCADGMSYRVGKLHLVFAMLALIAIPFVWKKSKTHSVVIGSTVLVLLTGVWLTTESSKLIWDVVPLMAFFQYPWRFLVLVTFAASLVAGSLPWMVEKVKSDNGLSGVMPLGLTGIGITIALILYIKLFVPQTILPKNAEDYTDQHSLRWVTSKISDEYMPRDFMKPENETEIVKNKLASVDMNATIPVVEEKTQSVFAHVTMPEDGDLLIRTAYFPGWQARVDGEPAEMKAFGRGILVRVPRGEHTVLLQLVQTPIETMGNAISISGIVVLIVGIMRGRRGLSA